MTTGWSLTSFMYINPLNIVCFFSQIIRELREEVDTLRKQLKEAEVCV